MRLSLPILFFLLFSRIFITPVWYSANASSIANIEHVFENIKLKKRRSSFMNEKQACDDIVIGISDAEEIKLNSIYADPKKLELYKHVYTTILSVLDKLFPPCPISIYKHFLRNRVLLI